MKVIIHIGLDVHHESIAVSLAPSDSIEVRRYGIIGGTPEHVQRLVKQLQAAHPDATLRFCYEAGPRGYPLCRFIRALGHECIIVCPSRVPRRPGDRVKTDRRDADQLARLLRAGELAVIHIPEPEDEAIRDLLRSRYQVVRTQHRARQQLKMFLLRHNASAPAFGLKAFPFQKSRALLVNTSERKGSVLESASWKLLTSWMLAN